VEHIILKWKDPDVEARFIYAHIFYNWFSLKWCK